MNEYGNDSGNQDAFPPLGDDLSAGRSAAEQKVKAPALGLIVTAILGTVLAIVNLIADLMGLMPPELSSTASLGEMGPVVSIVGTLIGLALMGVIYMGAARMQRLESWGFALAAAIVAMIPCSCSCVVGLPIGIWALVVLLNAEVKAQFR